MRSPPKEWTGNSQKTGNSAFQASDWAVRYSRLPARRTLSCPAAVQVTLGPAHEAHPVILGNAAGDAPMNFALAGRLLGPIFQCRGQTVERTSHVETGRSGQQQS